MINEGYIGRNPSGNIIYVSLLFALLINFIPVGHSFPFPDMVAVVLVFWNAFLPTKVGLFVAWFMGIVMDVHSGTLLGQHALAYSLLSYGAISLHRRLLWYSTISQAIQLIPLFVFTGTTQVRSVSSSGYLVTLKNRDDHIYSIKNSVNIFNRYSKLKTIVQSNNKALSYTGGEIEIASSEEGFLPEKVMHSAKIIKEELKKPKTEFFLNDFDLIPNYSDSTSSVISIYSPPEKKFFTYKLGVFASTIKNNPYARIVFNPKYQNKYLTVDLILDEYIALDGSPSIKNWSKPENFLSKIKSLDYLYGANYINYRSGSIDNVTFGHGLVIKNYTNKYNYPLTNRFGVDFEFKNRNFISFKVFVSDLSQASDNGAILGAHASLFVSKYIPLKMGVGLVSDMNQNHAVGADLNKKPIESLSFDFTYDLLNRKGYDINLISEIAALVYSDSYYYLRYEVENLDNALKNKDGSWGTAFGVDLSYNDFANIKTLIHYNDPLFVPSYFNATYEFERCRTRPKKDSYSALPEINAMFSDYEVTSLSDDNLIAIPKDLYLSYSEQEMVYSSIGTSIDFSYNYYDMVKAYFYYNIFFEPDNPISSDSFSSINLEILIL